MNKDKEPPSSTHPVQSTPLLDIEYRGPVVRIALNRPEHLNALNASLQSDLRFALKRIASDDSISVLILTGKGKGFCAGLDLKDFAGSLIHFQEKSDREEPGGNEDTPDSVFEALAAVPQPVIAAINGAAVTGGLEMVLSCDILLAAEGAYFGDTHVPVGVPPAAGLSQRLARSVGLHRALALSLSADFFSAEEACRWGLVHKVFPSGELLEEAWRMAEHMAQHDPAMLRDMKHVIRAGGMLPLGEGLRLEREFHDAWSEKNSSKLAGMGGKAVLERNRNQR